MNVPYLQSAYGGKSPMRNGLNHPTIAPYGAFTTSDGKQVLLSIQNEREWVKFCEGVLVSPDLVSDPRFNSNSNRVKNRDALSAIIEDVFAHHSRDALSDLLSKTGIASGQVSTIDDLIHHPQTRYIEVDTPTGPVRLLAPGALINGEIPQYGPVPALGQHS